ncbi:MAG: hypothetical protein LBJ84_00145 [Oscillospiraceae bacterium]|nr:hypothetical protein [Oscillospiraceae bacterium]
MTPAKAEQGAAAGAAAEYAHRGRIQAQISSFENGREIFSGVSMVKVENKRGGLTILEDNTPVAARVDGDVKLVGRDVYYEARNIKGFLWHVRNTFFLIINEKG